MARTPDHLDCVDTGRRLLMVVGGYGSGKTEVSVNLAIDLARRGRRVQVADLDIVNPYFRCREALRLMESHDIRVVVPPGSQRHADLPIIMPEIQGMLRPPAGTTSLFDVGGDDVGARALAAFRPRVADDGYELWQVINSKRPFTNSVEGCLALRRSIEATSRFAVTGLIANSHLIDETTPATILDGWRLARRVSEESGLPVRFVAAMESLVDAPELAGIDVPVLSLERHMLPPWRLGPVPGPSGAEVRGAQPAARPIPIGKPPRLGPTHRGETHG